ncbi:DUF6151 family protein [Albidovulum sp.]|jgi:hypothetical protein|uniref:DUF6151 family protein n=1 Tax=Albidovulum sp. TaxID=1872424 RepID=UPI0039B8A127
MPADRSLACRCGAMRWTIGAEAAGTHVECYCADCQTFARHLKADDYLDAAGGTEVFQTLPHHVRFTQGAANLRLLRLSPKGLLRWYAGCCGTPIANSMPSPSFPFVGMILRPGQSGFGPVLTHANTASARTPVRSTGLARAVLGLLARTAAAKLTGKGGTAPFFAADGKPAAEARILTLAERDAARPPRAG